jgi:hypothetical protein
VQAASKTARCGSRNAGRSNLLAQRVGPVKITARDRCKEPAISVKGEVIDLRYSGKAHTRGGSIQAVTAVCSMSASRPEASR